MSLSGRLKAEVDTWAKVAVILFNVIACLIISALVTVYLGALLWGEHTAPSITALVVLFIVWALLSLPLLFAASRLDWRGRTLVAVALVVYVILFGTTTACAAATAGGC